MCNYCCVTYCCTTCLCDDTCKKEKALNNGLNQGVYYNNLVKENKCAYFGQFKNDACPQYQQMYKYCKYNFDICKNYIFTTPN